VYSTTLVGDAAAHIIITVRTRRSPRRTTPSPDGFRIMDISSLALEGDLLGSVILGGSREPTRRLGVPALE
jgi:hypothetical protein